MTKKMSLINSFPEINGFFKMNRFSKSDLETFINEIEKKYIEKNIRKAALSLIKLELVKYEIQNLNKENQSITVIDNNRKTRKKRDRIKLRKSIYSKKKIVEKKPGKNENKYTKISKKIVEIPNEIPLGIIELSEYIENSPSFILRILANKSIIKTFDSKLSFDELNMIKPYIISRLNALKREQERIKRINSSTNKTTRSVLKYGKQKHIGVYDKIGLYGLGKIIYIRSK